MNKITPSYEELHQLPYIKVKDGSAWPSLAETEATSAPLVIATEAEVCRSR